METVDRGLKQVTVNKSVPLKNNILHFSNMATIRQETLT